MIRSKLSSVWVIWSLPRCEVDSLSVPLLADDFPPETSSLACFCLSNRFFSVSYCLGMCWAMNCETKCPFAPWPSATAQNQSVRRGPYFIYSFVVRARPSFAIFETKTESWLIFDEPVRPTLPATENDPYCLTTRHPALAICAAYLSCSALPFCDMNLL